MLTSIREFARVHRLPAPTQLALQQSLTILCPCHDSRVARPVHTADPAEPGTIRTILMHVVQKMRFTFWIFRLLMVRSVSIGQTSPIGLPFDRI